MITVTKILIALILGYYVLEVVRHCKTQYSKWDIQDSSLPRGYQVILIITIILTCIFWPVMLLKGWRKA